MYLLSRIKYHIFYEFFLLSCYISLSLICSHFVSWRWFSGLWRSWSCPSMLTNLLAPTVEATNANSLQLLLWLDTPHSSFWLDLPVTLPLPFSTLTAKIIFLISNFFTTELCLITVSRSKHDLVCHYRMSPPQVWTQRLVGSYGTSFLTSSRQDVL